ALARLFSIVQTFSSNEMALSFLFDLETSPSKIAARQLMPSATTHNQKLVHLMSNGDLRLSANRKCWPEQLTMGTTLSRALREEGWKPVRAHQFDPKKQHGFIDSQKMGMEIFRKLNPQSPLIVAESVWQYSHHVLPGLITHQGPILTLANWSGTWPGL